MKVSIGLLLSASSLFATAMGRTFTVYNACPFTIWPANDFPEFTTSQLFTDLNVGTATPSQPTGWSAPAFSAVSFFVPDNWKGRPYLGIYPSFCCYLLATDNIESKGRRNCDFSTNPGPNSCLDGGCNGGLLCDAHTGTGVPPATVAEFTLSTDPGVPDYYDISLVDGYNLPMRINNNQGCGVPLCGVDLGPNCPAPLKGPYDSTGFPVGCKSACVAGLAPDPNNSPNCCTGSHNTAATCPPSGVQYYSYFKSNCPNTYVYAYDESSGDALFSCPSSSRADYTITFCP
ncbi:Osmotin thaumatin-like protein [Lactarius psammicola]|nr:Osmotin thaumatin-like protein [Lactarius psammicola]